MNNKLVTSCSKQVLDNMKYKIARELSVNLRPDTSADKMVQLVGK